MKKRRGQTNIDTEEGKNESEGDGNISEVRRAYKKETEIENQQGRDKRQRENFRREIESMGSSKRQQQNETKV